MRRKFDLPGAFYIAGTACWVTAVVAVAAAPDVQLELGTRHLVEGRFEEALAAFAAASREDPADPESRFFSGVALNRLGRAAEALRELQAALRLGIRHPDVDFEIGWSLLMLRQWEEAIEHLQRFDVAVPGRGQTSEFLGRAYLAIGRLAEAEAALADALRRDPELLPTVSIYRALLRQRRGDESGARDELSALLRRAPDSSTGRLIRSQLEPVPGIVASPDRPWRLGLSIGGGYNSDARGVSFPEIDARDEREGSAFLRSGIDAALTLLDARRDWLAVGYQLVAEFYAEQETDPDLLDQYAYLEHRHSWDERRETRLRLSDNYTMVGEDSIRNQVGAHIAHSEHVVRGVRLEGSYGYAHQDYLFDVEDRVAVDLRDPDAVHRDAETHTLTLATHLKPTTGIDLRVGAFHTWNFAQGDDFDYEGDGVFAGARFRLPWRMMADVSYVHNLDRYKDHNSALLVHPGFSRRDEVNGLSLRLTRPLGPRLTAFVEYNYNRDNSNIRGYDYRQHVTTAGLAWQF